jgi:anti-sigma-K factor RskA
MRDDSPIGIDDDRALDDAALEALAEIHAVRPSAGLRARVLAEARADAAGARKGRALTRWRIAGSIAAAAALVLAGQLARESRISAARVAQIGDLARTNAELTTRLDAQGRTLASLQNEVAAQAHVLRVLGGTRTLSVALAPQGGVAGSGRVLVDAASGEAAVVLAGVAPSAEGKTYELWAIRGKQPPEPAGLFRVGAEATLAVRVDRVPNPEQVTAFAVSIEPASGSPAPTGPVVLLGTVAG